MPAESRLRHGSRVADDSRPEELIARRAPGRWGVFTRAELIACGLSREGIARRVRQGWLRRVHRGVYVVGWLAPAPEPTWLAAVKACGPAAVLSHRAAGELWGVLEYRAPVEVTIPGPGTRAVAGVVVHRSRLLEPDQIAVERDVPVTSAARTLIDLAAVLGFAALRQAVRRAQGKRLVTLPKLIALIEHLGPRRGSKRLRSIIASGPAGTRTVLEDIVLDLLLRAGFEHPDVNVPITIGDRRIIPDFRWPGVRLTVEADGAAWHDQPVGRDDDAERQALLEAHGERVLRVTWDQAVRRPRATVARVEAAGAPRPGHSKVA